MAISTKFMIKRLILVGHRKNYIVPFNPGVNIIYGDADTGKSSILRLINYLLGGKEIHLDHEIVSSVLYALLEVENNGNIYCIKRDIFNSGQMVEVYPCKFEEINDYFPEKYSPSFGAKDAIQTSFSEYLFSEFNFPNVEIKQSPTKDNSALARLSIRDLFKYMYLSQDNVGSRKLLNSDNPIVAVKNREVFKYIFNVLDSKITDIDAEISSKSNEKNNLQHKSTIISGFLDDVEFDSTETITNELKVLEEKKLLLNNRLENLNGRITSNSKTYKSFKSALDTIRIKISENENKQSVALRNIERFGRLKNDYLTDIGKIKSIRKASSLIGKKPEIKSSCPICDSEILVENISDVFTITGEDKIGQEINSLTRRIKDLDQIIIDNRRQVTEYTSLLSELDKEQILATKFIDEEMATSISPYLAERDTIVSEIGAVASQEKRYQHDLKIVNRHLKITENISKLEASIDRLQARLDKLRLSAPSIDDVLASLGLELNKYLEKIQIKNKVGVSISARSYLPVLRDVEYPKINSGGMRTILSIGYLAAILKLGINSDLNLPNILMIDTVGKYLGKTAATSVQDTDDEEDVVEGVSDPSKYKNIYEYLIDVSEEFELNAKLCQIFLVDNDIPPEIAMEYKGFVVAQYSSDGVNDLPIGLIDDWDSFMSKM